jgi:hypothetical protein
LEFESAGAVESDRVSANEIDRLSASMCVRQLSCLIVFASSHLQALLTTTNNLIPTNKRIKFIPLSHSARVPYTAIILRLLIANLLQLELAVLATINRAEGIDAILLE